MTSDWNGAVRTDGSQRHYTALHPIPFGNAYGCNPQATSIIDLRQTQFVVDPSMTWPVILNPVSMMNSLACHVSS